MSIEGSTRGKAATWRNVWRTLLLEPAVGIRSTSNGSLRRGRFGDPSRENAFRERRRILFLRCAGFSRLLWRRRWCGGHIALGFGFCGSTSSVHTPFLNWRTAYRGRWSHAAVNFVDHFLRFFTKLTELAFNGIISRPFSVIGGDLLVVDLGIAVSRSFEQRGPTHFLASVGGEVSHKKSNISSGLSPIDMHIQ